MDETTSEADFLLTELRYTLGQLHVQLGDLGSGVRPAAAATGRSADQIVAELTREESTYQAQYARLLGVSLPPESGAPAADPEAAFVAQRERTLRLLEQAGDTWPPELIDAVKQHVAHDRSLTTEIANLRKTLFDEDQRPDLNQPLTRSR